MSGDPALCAAVVRIIEARVRLLGVGTPPAKAAEASAQPDVAGRTLSRCLTTVELPEGSDPPGNAPAHRHELMNTPVLRAGRGAAPAS